METMVLVVIGLLVLGIVTYQIVKAAGDSGCTSCGQECSCKGDSCPLQIHNDNNKER